MAKKKKEDFGGLRLKFAPYINRHHRITLTTTEQILMGRTLLQNQQIIKQNRELIKLLKEISRKLSGQKTAEKKPEGKRIVHLRSPKVINQDKKGEKVKPLSSGSEAS